MKLLLHYLLAIYKDSNANDAFHMRLDIHDNNIVLLLHE